MVEVDLTEVKRALDTIWRAIPDLPGCLRCGACCGPHDWAYCEWLVITAWLKERGLKEKFARSLFDRCPYYRPEDGSCEIYPVRPVICRLYGVAEGLECPFVKAPVKLSRKRAYELLGLLRQIDRDLRQHGHITVKTWERLQGLENTPILMPDGGMVLRPGTPALGELSLEEIIEALRTRLAEELLAVDDVIAKLEGIEIRGELVPDTIRKKGKTYGPYWRLKLYEDNRYHAWGRYLGKEVPARIRAGVEAYRLLQEIRPIRRQLERLTAKLDVLLANIQGLLMVLRNHLSQADIILSLAELSRSENQGDSSRET